MAPAPSTRLQSGPEAESSPRASASDVDSKTARAAMACLWCRERRTRCSGEKPVCQACSKAGVVCEYPLGRKRKRTRIEMEEAKLRLTRHATEASVFDPSTSSAALQDPTARLPRQDELHLPSAANNNQAAVTTTLVTIEPPVVSISRPSPSPPKGWPVELDFPLGQAGVADDTSQPHGDTGSTGGFASLDWSAFGDLDYSGFLRGHPGEDSDLELYYYRSSGATAIQPGLHRVNLRHQSRSNQATLAEAPQPFAEAHAAVSPTILMELFDDTGLPYTHVWEPLFALFLQNQSQFFPSLSRQRMKDRWESGTMSRMLANAICALAASHAEESTGLPIRMRSPFIVKAQELVSPLAHLPTTESVSGYLFLGWSCYGQGSDSGVWQYSGMATRMAIDIGIHEVSEIYDSPAHLVRTRLLWWVLFITDRIVAFATGRLCSIPEEIIEVPLPEDRDFFPDAARDLVDYDGPVEPVEPVPFVQLVKLMLICGRISNLVNGRRGRARTLLSSIQPLADQLQELQTDLVRFFDELPVSLQWGAENFKHQVNRGHGGVYLAVHLWANAVLAMVFNPRLMKQRTGTETPAGAAFIRDLSLSSNAAKQVCEQVTSAKLISAAAYTGMPFFVQPLFIAGMSTIFEIQSLQASLPQLPANSQHFLSISKRNLATVMVALSEIEKYWSGARSALGVLEKRSGQRRDATSSPPRPLINLPDRGLLKRFTLDPRHPKHLAQPTDTSLRDYQARMDNPPQDTSFLADLLSDYNFESFSFLPTDMTDIGLRGSTANAEL